MSNRAFALPLSVVLLLGVAQQLRQPRPAPPPADAAPATGSSAPASPGSSRASLPDAGKVRVLPTGRQLVEDFLLAEKPVNPCFPAVGTLVATLPDPTDSHLDWAFDADFEAILRAYERAGYVLDRFWLPWSEKLDTMGTSPNGGGQARLRHIYPGVVLFRRDTTNLLVTAVPAESAGVADSVAPAAVAPAAAAGAGSLPALAADSARRGVCVARPGVAAPAQPDLQLLYIVGEVPTGGVHKQALRAALDDRDAVLRRSAAPAGTDLLIVGPSFSGSSRSLSVVLERWRRAHPTDSVKVVTGSATSVDGAALLRHDPRLAFSATVHSDSALTAALVAGVLCPLGIGEDQVAVLRESGTTYGRQAVGAAATGPAATSWPVESGGRREAEPRFSCGHGKSMRPGRFVQIPFPMNIASLRAEFEDHPAGDAQALPAPRSRAHLTLRDPERPGDRPPPSSRLTAPTQEVVLNEIESAVTGHRIRAVGILASDVRDKLFLASELRRRLRDVQLFTFEGNALYLVPENNEALRGMLVVSSYPLNIQSQWWTASRLLGERLSFADDGTQGIHNAVLMQLGYGALAADYGYPFLPGAARLSHATRVKPPVWVSTIGRSQILPVTVLTVPDTGFMASVAPAPPHQEEWPTIQFLTGVEIALLGAALLSAFREVAPGRPPRRVRPVAYPLERDARKRLAGTAPAEKAPWPRRAWSRITGRLGPPRRRRGDPGRAVTPLARGSGTLRRLARAADGRPPPREGGRRPLRARWAARTSMPGGRRAPAPCFRRPVLRDLRDEAMLDEVRWGTQNFHVLAYVTMRGLALLGVFLPVALVTGWSLLRRSPFQGPGAGWRWLVLVWLDMCLVLAVVGAARLLRECWRHFRAVQPLGTLLTLTGWGGEGRTRRSWRLEVVLRAVVFAAAAASFVLSAWLTWQIVHLARLRVTFPLFLYRASRLDSGVSPLVPLLLAAAGFALWSTWHVRRVLDLGQTTPYEEAWDEPPAPEPVGATALPRSAGHWVRAIRMRLFKVVPEERGELLLLGIVAVAAALGGQIAYTIDGMIGLRAFNLLLKLSVAGSLVATCWAVVRLVSVWRALDHVLQALSETPLLPAFRRLPARVAQLTRLTLLRSPSRDVVDTISAAQWRQMKQLCHEARADFEPLEVYPAVQALLAPDAPPPSRRPRRLLRGRDDSFARLNRILSALWAMEPDSKVVTQIYEELKKGHSDDSTVALVRRSVPSLVRLWLRAAEEFAAVQVVDYVEWVLQQLRTLTLFLFVSLILTTALLSSYPYQPQSVAKLVFLFVLLGTVGTLLYVMAALNRDDVLSAIAKTDPGRVTWDRSFIVNAVAVAVVPLLTLISSELPDWHLFKWLDPLLRVFGGGH